MQQIKLLGFFIPLTSGELRSQKCSYPNGIYAFTLAVVVMPWLWYWWDVEVWLRTEIWTSNLQMIKSERTEIAKNSCNLCLQWISFVIHWCSMFSQHWLVEAIIIFHSHTIVGISIQVVYISFCRDNSCLSEVLTCIISCHWYGTIICQLLIPMGFT